MAEQVRWVSAAAAEREIDDARNRRQT
jgi:hypothetical protein